MKLLVLLTAVISMLASNTVYDFQAKDIKGKDVSLAEYKGKVLLIVNVASHCGYTKHYAPLEAMYRKYKDKGLVVLGFPSNDFGEQEPGTEEEIMQFCKTNFDVSFPMFSKVSTQGDHQHPLYTYLTSGGGKAELSGEIPWNFEKFLIGRDGHILHRFKFKADPESEEFISEVEKALAQ